MKDTPLHIQDRVPASSRQPTHRVMWWWAACAEPSGGYPAALSWAWRPRGWPPGGLEA